MLQLLLIAVIMAIPIALMAWAWKKLFDRDKKKYKKPTKEDWKKIVWKDMGNERIEKSQDPQLNIAVVVRSAYFVSVEGRGDMFVVADNIAEACNKLDKMTNKNYIFIHSRSFDCAM